MHPCPAHHPSNRPLLSAAARPALGGLFLLLGWLLAACGSPTPAPPAPAPAIQQVADPTATPLPPPTQADTPAPAAPVTDLPALVAEAMHITLQPGSGQWEGVEVLKVAPDLWAVYTTGFRSFDPPQNHAVGIYTQEDGHWVELGWEELVCSDYMDPRAVSQVFLDEQSIWLAVDSGTGAHSGCFDLLRWDGAALTTVVSGFNSSPGAGEVRDVDGDGQPEVVLNATDPYVFCYACGVRLYNISILRWNGTELAPVELTRLPDDTVADLRDANNRAVELAQASLFPAALPLIDEALGYAPNDKRVYWNHQIIHALADGRRDYAGSTPFPLLNWIFYGDWEAALAELDDYTPAQLFDPQKALLQTSAAAGWEEALADWILLFAGPALEAQPDLAPAWFLQGWAHFLKDPGDPAAAASLEKAAQLAPETPLYRESRQQVQSRGVVQPADPTVAVVGIPSPAGVESVRFQPGATIHLLHADLSGGQAQGYELGIGAGQKLFVNGPADVKQWLVTAAGQSLPGVAEAGATRYDIPTTANYTLIVQGSAPAELLLAIPPLTGPETTPPTRTEEVRFPVGGTSATLEATLRRGAPVGYRLGIAAGQRLWVTATTGDAGFWLLDPDGKSLSPLNRTTRVGEFAIPRTGNYTLVLDGEGPVQVVVEIPPR